MVVDPHSSVGIVRIAFLAFPGRVGHVQTFYLEHL